MNQEQIFKKSHQPEASQLARDYFKQKGVRFENLGEEDYQKLREFVNKEIYILLANEDYSMIKDLRVNKKIKKDRYGFFLTAEGSYFDEREAISFYNPKTNDRSITIGFCGWADGCNRIPFIKGFIKWCDWVVKNVV